MLMQSSPIQNIEAVSGDDSAVFAVIPVNVPTFGGLGEV